MHTSHTSLVRFLLVVMMATLLAAGHVATAPPADAATVAERQARMEQGLARRINNARELRGLRPLKVAGELRRAARGNSHDMARARSIFHNPDLTSDVGNWRYIAENVSYAHSVKQTHRMLMRSPKHRANILSPKVTQLGVGVRLRGGVLYTTQVFRRPG